jgi:hypothetical protein
MADFYPGLSDSEAADLASSQYGSTSTGNSGSSLLTTLANLTGAGVTAYANANKPKPKPSSSLPLLIGGAVALLLIIVLIIKK